MRTRIGFEDTVGKTIEAVGEVGGSRVFVFTDNTFHAIGYEKDWDGDVELVDVGLDDFDSDDKLELARLGVFSNEEVERMNAARQAQIDVCRAVAAEMQERRERAVFERLQKKYGAA